MGIAVQLLGIEGTGKTYSLRNLNPKETYYINCDKKSLPFRDWRNIYSEENKNYFKTSDANQIAAIIKGVSAKAPHIKQIVVDTVCSIMSDKVMSEMKKPGYDKWGNLAYVIYELYNLANSDEIREDLVVIFIGHVEPYNDNSETKWRLKVYGQQLNKLNIEGKLSYTFYTEVERAGDDVKYMLSTQSNGYNTARTPAGIFDYKIDNDMNFCINEIRKFEGLTK